MKRCPTFVWNTKYGGCEFLIKNSDTNRCLIGNSENDYIHVRECKNDVNSAWVFSDGRLINVGRGACLINVSLGQSSEWRLSDCKDVDNKKWRLFGNLGSSEERICFQDTTHTNIPMVIGTLTDSISFFNLKIVFCLKIILSFLR